MNDFKLGDVVSLKSGSFSMVIGDIRDDEALCIWMAKDKGNHKQFPLSCLCHGPDTPETYSPAIGAVVRLKSGSPDMTVVHIEGDSSWVVYRKDDDSFEEFAVPNSALYDSKTSNNIVNNLKHLF